MPSPTVENYLKAMLALSQATGEVNITDLSHALDVSKPAANGMVKSLAAQGLVEYERYKPLSLTPEGRRVAALIVRKHRLTEMYLVDQMGFGWEEVHDIAEQIEHIDSPRFFARMDELMGYPTHDPHGSPIPTSDGVVAPQNFRSLAEAQVGERVVLRAVAGHDDALFSLLTRKEIGLDTVFEVVEVEPFDGSVRVRYDSAAGQPREETLTTAVAGRMQVG